MTTKSRGSSNRIWAYCALTALLIAVPGCRKDPANPPKYYESELRAMKKEARQMSLNEQTKFLEDGYPWEKKTGKAKCLPCRISDVEKPLEQELDYLHTFIHGKKRTKLRLRD